MNRLLACWLAMPPASWLVAPVVALLCCTLASAQTVVINQVARGWYAESGQLSLTGNYLVGDSRGANCGSSCHADVRNLFVFDLAGLNQPIASAKLVTSVPASVPSGPHRGYLSVDPSETYELHEIVTPVAALLNGTDGIATWTNIGSGVIYGSRTMTAADNGMAVEITLNSAAVAALDATSGLIGIGGVLTTLDSVPNSEYTFGYTGNSTDATQLRLILVPEPSAVFMVTLGAISLLGSRVRHR